MSPRQREDRRAQHSPGAAAAKRPTVLPPPPQKPPARTRVALPRELPATAKLQIRKLKSKRASHNLRHRKRVYLAEMEARVGALEREKLDLAAAERRLRAEHAALQALAAERNGPQPLSDLIELEIDDLFKDLDDLDHRSSPMATHDPSVAHDPTWEQPSRSDSLALPELPTPTATADHSSPAPPISAELLGLNSADGASLDVDVTLTELFGHGSQHKTGVDQVNQSPNLNQILNPDTYRTRTPGATNETPFEHALFPQSDLSLCPTPITPAISLTLASIASLKQPLVALTTALVATFLASLTLPAGAAPLPHHRATGTTAPQGNLPKTGSTRSCASSGALSRPHQHCRRLLAKPPRPRLHSAIPVA